jgi:acetyltransferase-like isoleucine patch superfamily enzyme
VDTNRFAGSDLKREAPTPEGTVGPNQRAFEGDFEVIEVDADCWFGASSIIITAVGFGATIGAGTLVVPPKQVGFVAVGNPHE